MSTIRTNSITDAAGTGAPDFPNGLAVDGNLNFSTQDKKIAFAAGNASSNTIRAEDIDGFASAEIKFLGVGPNQQHDIVFSTGSSPGSESITERMRITSGSFVGIGTSAPASTLDVNGTITAGTLRLPATGDVSLASTGHAFQIGTDTSFNLAMDNNEIQARNNGAAGQLSLNADGGNVNIGSAGASVNVEGTLAIQGSVTGLPAPTAAQVGDATADLAAGAVGTYAFLRHITNISTDYTLGQTLAGSALNPASLGISRSGTGASGYSDATAISGTWRVMGRVDNLVNSYDGTTLFLRIS